MKRPLRMAFTVVELLVVIAIISVLMALMLPAVQSVRETARRTQCASHLKQIAMGSLSHNTQWEFFPNAGVHYLDGRVKSSSGAPVLSPRQNWGAFYQILPYIEEENVYELPNDVDAAAAVIKIYFCPSRRKPVALPGVQSGMPSGLRGAIDYAGNGGSGHYTGTTNPAAGSGPDVFYNAASWNDQNGIIIPRTDTTRPYPVNNERIALGTIKDGASYTMMFGERNFNRWGRPSDWDENNGYINAWDWDTIRWSYGTPAPDRKDNTFWDLRFGSSHPMVVNAAMCDGSVKAIPYNIDLTVFRNLTVRNDGKSPQLP